MKLSLSLRLPALALLSLLALGSHAEVTRIEVTERQTLSEQGIDLRYEAIHGVVHFTLDPEAAANQAVTDLQYAPRNAQGLVEYSADFKLLVPAEGQANGGLLYQVNNRGGAQLPPEQSLRHPLSEPGFTFLATGWINELEPRDGRLRLRAPTLRDDGDPITGEVRYEVSVEREDNDVNIAGGGHLAYAPTEDGLAEARLSQRLYQSDPRIPIERSDFELRVEEVADSNQPMISLHVEGGLQPGYIYELIYEAQDPVLAGAGMAGIRDLVSLLRYGGEAAAELESFGLPEIEHSVAWGVSQSGRLLRQFVYDGFNADLEERIVFDGVVPIIAGGGFGMFNNRFAMPTRTNGHHSNYLYPNDLFPFTYGDSTDPFSGRRDGILRKSRETGTTPRVMHIQTSNEYWLRAGSLPHTDPSGREDAEIPEEVRFYTIGGSQHGSRDGLPRPASRGQLPDNPNMWSPISESLIMSMYRWVAEGEQPPASRYPRIADGSLVASHRDGRINERAWRSMEGVRTPASMYQPRRGSYGERWERERIIDSHPEDSDEVYLALVPAVDEDNNDLAESTVLPPLTTVPLGTFVPWNLRAPQNGAEEALARLTGGYIPFASNTTVARQTVDRRPSLEERYEDHEDYLNRFERATDELIDEGFLLPGYKERYMDVARRNADAFER